MPVIQGFVSNRKRQWGYQGSNANVITTAAAATRVLPWSGPMDVNPNWTFEDVDDGSLIGFQAPSQRRWDVTSPPAGPLAYDDLAHLFTPLLHGGVTPTGGGAAKTWTFQPDYQVPANKPLGLITEQFGDDVLTDWFQLLGGVFETVTISGEVGGGPLQMSGTMRFATAKSTGSTSYPVSGTVPTAGLTIDDTPAWVYLDDAELYINDTAGTIGTTKISDALHTFNLTITNNFDLKSYANGSNTRFQIAGYGRGDVTAELALQFAKVTTAPATVGTGSESDDWMFATAVKRFVELKFTSPELAQAGIPYSWSLRMPMFYTTREDGEIGNNTTVTLTGSAKEDATLGYAIRSVVVNTVATL